MREICMELLVMSKWFHGEATFGQLLSKDVQQVQKFNKIRK
jgi:hypothetical protein